MSIGARRVPALQSGGIFAAARSHGSVPLTWQIVAVLAVLAGVLAGLVRAPHLADIIFVGAIVALSAMGIVTPQAAFSGFTNEGLLTIAALFIVAAGMVETGLLERMVGRLLGGAGSSAQAAVRLLPVVAAASAFLNNTAVVAMLLPVLLEWTRKRRIAASKLLLPLSFAALLGGVCTLIGTSTNLVVHGMLRSAGRPGFGMWELGRVGIPIAVAGTLLLLWLAPRLLPERKEFLEQLGESRREFLVEMLVQPDCPLIGRTIETAGLRHLPGLFLVEIEREGRPIAPVGPDEHLESGDRLVFTGVVSTIVDLQKIPGLTPTADDYVLLEPGGPRLGLAEAVLSPSSPLIGRGVREAGFRTAYDAAVIAIHRNGVRLEQKIGDVVLRPGDTLLLRTGPDFVGSHRNNPDFFLVSEAGDARRPRQHRAIAAGAIAAALIVALTVPDVLMALGTGSVSAVPAQAGMIGDAVPSFAADAAEWLSEKRVLVAFLAAAAMLTLGCVTVSEARRAIDWRVLVMIGAAIGMGRAVDESGAAAWLAQGIVSFTREVNPLLVLAVIYLVTWGLTEVLSNNAAAALMVPIALAAAQRVGADPHAFAVVVAVAASGGFVLPAGYQTHLMVFGPGGYRLSDFMRIGFPMGALWFAITMLLVPRIWSVGGS